jgi:transcriptional regulator with XRE-family HTH domain
MKERIRQIMESQHMTQQVFAEFIGTSPATLSGIFNGRTNPTLAIVELIKKKIPDINTDWLMFGSGQMYKTANDAPGSYAPPQEYAVEGTSQAVDQMLDFGESLSPTPQQLPQQQPIRNSVKPTPSIIVREEVKHIDKPQRRVTEIRVYYDDQTWESFVPSKK